MPIATLVPTAEGAHTAWSLVAGGTKTAAVTAPDDADTTCIGLNAANGANSFTMSDLPAYAISVTTHTISNSSRWTAGTSGTFANRIRKSGADTDGTPVIGTGSYVTRTNVDLSGAALTVAAVNAAEIGVVAGSMGAPDGVRCTTVSWEVTYVSSPGGLIFLFLQWFGPLVAISLHEIPRLAAALHARSRTLIEPREYADVYRELREARYARHFLPGMV